MVPLRQSDNELLVMISRKDAQAFRLLYDRYYDLLWTTAYKKLADELTAEELVQDVFVVFWQKASGLDEDGDVRSYLFATLRNKILYEFRTRMARASLEAVFEPIDEVTLTDASDLLIAKELEQRINAAIEDLSPRSRKAFELSRYEHMPYKKIAEEMNISVTAVEKHIMKALYILRKEFKEIDGSLLIALTISVLQMH